MSENSIQGPLYFPPDILGFMLSTPSSRGRDPVIPGVLLSVFDYFFLFRTNFIIRCERDDESLERPHTQATSTPLYPDVPRCHRRFIRQLYLLGRNFFGTIQNTHVRHLTVSSLTFL